MLEKINTVLNVEKKLLPDKLFWFMYDYMLKDTLINTGHNLTKLGCTSIL